MTYLCDLWRFANAYYFRKKERRNKAMGNNSPPIREFSTRKFKYGFSARLFYWEPPPGESKPPP